MGQRLATRLRVLMLRSLLRQDAAFFDRPENGSGALMGSLAADAAAVRGAVGDRLGVLLTVLSCIIASYVIAFYHRCGRGRAWPCGARSPPRRPATSHQPHLAALCIAPGAAGR